MKKLLTLLALALLCWNSTPHAQVAKVVFLATYDGTGTDTAPFRPRGMGTVTNMGCIDLRADPTQAAGRALCGADSLPAGTGITQLSSRLDELLTAQRRTQLESALGITIPADATPIDILKLVLIELPKTNIRWKPLRVGRDGLYKIWLGGNTTAYRQTAALYPYLEDNGLVADATNVIIDLLEPAIAWATSIAEDFNCADNAALTCDLTWTEVTGTDWEIFSNTARADNVAQNDARADSTLATDDHDVIATLTALSSDGGGFTRCGVMGRKDNSGTRTYYMGFADHNAAAPLEWETAKRVAGTFTALSTNGQDPANADIMKLRIDGSDVSLYVNDVLVVGPTTDVTITGNTYTGIIYNGNGATPSCRLDNFSASDFVVAATGRNRGAVLLP